MTFHSLEDLLTRQLFETDREYADISDLPDEKKMAVREREYAEWVEANKDYWMQRDVKNALDNIVQLNVLIQSVLDAGIPLPRTRFASTELGTILATPVLARLKDFEDLQQTFFQVRENRGVYRSINDDCVLLTVAPLWSQTRGVMESEPHIDVLMPAWTTYQLAVRLEEYKKELLKTDTPKPAPRKRVKLLEEERVWRMNYFLRVYYGNIPKRDDSKDKGALQTLYELWTRNETPTKEQTEAIEKWKQLQEQRAKQKKGKTPLGEYKASRARAVRGKWYVVRFNSEYGLLYNEEVDGPDHENDFGSSGSNEQYHKMVDLFDSTSLMYPISDNAVPAPVEMDEKKAEEWQRKCPPWMSTWSHKLVRHQRESFIMF